MQHAATHAATHPGQGRDPVYIWRVQTAIHCNTHRNILEHTLQHIQGKAEFLSIFSGFKLEYTATHTAIHSATYEGREEFLTIFGGFNLQQVTATHRKTATHTATHCNTLQHTL